MSEERFKLSLTYSHSQGYGAAIYHGGNKLTFEEVSALLNTAVFTREEAMQKWGLIERPQVSIVKASVYVGEEEVYNVYSSEGSYDVYYALQRALGITKGGGDGN